MRLSAFLDALPGDAQGPVSRRYESIFCIFLILIAFLFRDNPYLVYPQILYLLLLLLALNLAAGVALRAARFGKQLSAGIILANCGTIAAIISYSGEQASNLWVLFLLPIYTACVLLDGREAAWITAGSVACETLYYLLSAPVWDAVVYFEISIKSAILAFAAAATWRVVLQERSARRKLSDRSAELERTENYLHLFRRLVGQIDDALLVVNPQTGRMVDVNGTWSRRLGYSREELNNPSLADWPGVLPEQLSWKELARKVREEKSLRFDCAPRRRDRSQCPMEINIQWAAQEGKDYLIAVARDTTERRQAEAQLRQVQKMEALGRLASGVAHDFNNLLSVIISVSDMMLETLDGESPLRPDLEQIRDAGDRSAALTRQLLAFSRQQVTRPGIVDVNAVIQETTRLLRRTIGEHIRIETVLAPELGRIQADRGHLQQALLNLAVNARDAMPRGGRLLIETLNAEIKEELAWLHDSIPPGAYAMLRVEDTGTGMDEETQARLFEPFFTTKEAHKGTGLGLSVIHGIVKQSGGYIHVRSSPGRGAAFTLYFPRTSAPPDAQPQPEPKTAASASETILLVEDEEAVREVARRILSREGYQVLAARDGEEALKLAGSRPGPIHLLLSDVVMPGMSGPELAARLSDLPSKPKTLFMSGFVNADVLRQISSDPRIAFIQKPLVPEAFVRKVRETLDSHH